MRKQTGDVRVDVRSVLYAVLGLCACRERRWQRASCACFVCWEARYACLELVHCTRLWQRVDGPQGGVVKVTTLATAMFGWLVVADFLLVLYVAGVYAVACTLVFAV